MKRLNSIILLGLIVFLFNPCTSTIFAQNIEYYPLQIGNYWVYNYTNSNHSLTVKITNRDIDINGKKYFKIKRVFSWNEESVDFARNENGVHYSYDEKSKGESVEIPKELVVGTIWKHFDGSWEYEILSTNDSITLPTGWYNELLKIRATQLSNRDKSKNGEYTLYYKKGIGNIAAMGNGELMTYLVEFKTK